jgi:hypothetical protein
VLIDPAIRCTVVGEEHESGVVALRRGTEEIEGRIVVEEEVLGVASLRADTEGWM